MPGTYARPGLAATCILFASGLTAQTRAGVNAFTASPFMGFHDPVVEASLYNPPVAEVPWKYPYKPETTVRKLDPILFVSAKGLPDGGCTLAYRLESDNDVVLQGSAAVAVLNGAFQKVFTLDRPQAKAARLVYEITPENRAPHKGAATLRWSRFSGTVSYLDGGWRSTYIRLFPNGFASPATFYVPVAEDGSFDALLPARVYSVVNVNGAGYSYDSMERWGWDYDLTRDRRDAFTIGRTELYGIHAFNIKGGPPTVFVTFRPTSLSRVLQFDADGDGLTSSNERKRMGEEMKHSPTVIGPELTASDVAVWLNGHPQRIVQFDKIPEYGGDSWQVQYLLQFYPEPRASYGVWHEIKLEVRSREVLRGKEVVDFGQGSVGFYRH